MMMEFKVEISRGSNEFIGVCFGLLALACYAGFILVNRMIRDEVHVDHGSDGMGMDEDGYPTSEEDERDPVVYLLEARQIGYLPEQIKEELGWGF